MGSIAIHSLSCYKILLQEFYQTVYGSSKHSTFDSTKPIKDLIFELNLHKIQATKQWKHTYIHISPHPFTHKYIYTQTHTCTIEGDTLRLPAT